MAAGKPLDKDKVMVGQLVQDMNANVGTIRWIGKLEKIDKPPNNDTGTYCAVEFQEPTEALHRFDGTWHGKKLCDAKPGSVELLKPKQLTLERNRVALAEFRKAMGTALSPPLPDRELIKFLIARKFEIPKSVEMLTNHQKWLAETKVDPNEFFPPELMEWYPCGFGEGRDRDGNLLYYERPGNGGISSPKAVCQAIPIPVLAKWHATMMLKGRLLMREKNCKRITSIIDIKNLGETSGSMDFAKAIAKIDQDNFPEHLGKMYIVNAPTLFSALWRIIRVFLDERTKDKITVLKGEYEETLERQVERKWWPPHLGGENNSWMSLGGRVGGTDPALKHDAGKFAVEKLTDEELAEAEKPTPKEKEADPDKSFADAE